MQRKKSFPEFIQRKNLCKERIHFLIYAKKEINLIFISLIYAQKENVSHF